MDEIGMFSFCYIDSTEHTIMQISVRNVHGTLEAEGVYYTSWNSLKQALRKSHALGKAVGVHTHFMDTYL